MQPIVAERSSWCLHLKYSIHTTQKTNIPSNRHTFRIVEVVDSWFWSRCSVSCLIIVLQLLGSEHVTCSYGYGYALYWDYFSAQLAENRPSSLRTSEVTLQIIPALFRAPQARSHDKSTRHIKSFFVKSVTYANLMSHSQVSQDLDGSDLFDETFSSFVNASFSRLWRLGWSCSSLSSLDRSFSSLSRIGWGLLC